MKVFVWKNGKAEAQSGYNDDLVMSFGTAMYIRDTALKFKSPVEGRRLTYEESIYDKEVKKLNKELNFLRKEVIRLKLYLGKNQYKIKFYNDHLELPSKINDYG